MKNMHLHAIECAAMLSACIGATSAAAAALPVITVQAPTAVLKLEVAQAEADRMRGLMGRRSLAEHQGMIFVFGSDADQHFWMKDTLIPLDMVFVSAKGKVTSISDHVPAVTAGESDTDVPRRAGSGRFVLELPAGEALRDGLKAGVELHLPAFP